MEPRKNLKGAGAAFIGSGVAFLATSLLAEQPAFIGVACAFLALGVVYLGKARQDR